MIEKNQKIFVVDERLPGIPIMLGLERLPQTM
jgi:hypothetical protein